MELLKMSKTKKIGLHLDTEAIQLLAELAPNENRKGQYISQLLREAAARRAMGTESGPPLDGADEQTALRAELARLAGELARIAQVAAEMAQVTERLLALEHQARRHKE